MKNFKKIMMVLIVLTIFATVPVYAALQSRPGLAESKKTVDQWYETLRRTETGIFGKIATFEVVNDSIAETSASNGIDVHMIKSTEWGAMVMLAASTYGSGSSSNANSTGNNYGVMNILGDEYSGEITAAGYFSALPLILKNGKNRYVDRYQTTSFDTAYKVGDATYETKNFPPTTTINIYSNSATMIRGVSTYFRNYTAFGARGMNSGSAGGTRVVVWSAAEI